jgi:hypothetical protein
MSFELSDEVSAEKMAAAGLNLPASDVELAQNKNNLIIK